MQPGRRQRMVGPLVNEHSSSAIRKAFFFGQVESAGYVYVLAVVLSKSPRSLFSCCFVVVASMSLSTAVPRAATSKPTRNRARAGCVYSFVGLCYGRAGA